MYTTTMGIVRGTYQMCLKVRQILRTHLVKFDERDVFMSREVQAEIRDRMSSEQILVPQVFIDGQYIGVCILQYYLQSERNVGKYEIGPQVVYAWFCQLDLVPYNRVYLKVLSVNGYGLLLLPDHVSTRS